jgi:co-chaperonin GroES (HSP10)
MTSIVNLEPMGDRVLIMPEMIKDKNISGIIIP